ncbi:hypothetical protein [Hymenobacter edaphi]|uniref:hypothetical protein n=1 Tax=Hymenobacter edaphi TaxID=2211146 RepID=UPI00140306CB|nr:hypothetical protein [Hymenobacter edaphi]
MRQRADERRLGRLLQAWYERRLPLRETYRGQPALLLRHNLSYEDLQAFRQRYGVKLSE